MGTTFRLGRIRGVAVDVSWTVLVIVGLVTWSLASQTLPEAAPGQATGVYWSVAGCGALALMASILAHEVSHAVVANRNGVPVEGITLWMFGGLARLGRQARDASVELRIALAGPAMSVAIGGSCLLLAALGGALGGPELLTTSVAWLGAINLVLAVFNLLPGAPLDGGRVLTAILWRRSGDGARARRQAAHAGQVVGQLLIALGVLELAFGAGIGGVWLAVIGWFLTSGAHAEAAQLDLIAALEGVHVGDVMTTEVRTVDRNRTVADFVRHEAMTTRASSLPVVDNLGNLHGLVTLRRLREVPRAAWGTTTLGAVAVPADELAVASADEPLVEALGRAGAGDGRILVVDGRQLVGIVTPSDVTAALERGALTRSRGGGVDEG
jgi:Zn-dependent protease/CBS domain-containing protein